MGELCPWPEKWNESEEENAEPAEPVQLALTGGGHTEAGKGLVAMAAGAVAPAADDNHTTSKPP